jgi:hypothetical protein
MPWAISFLHDFKVPKEKVNVTDAYNYFVRWANSGGTDNSDWYKDNLGNRNLDKIKKNKRPLFIFKFLLNTEIKRGLLKFLR